MADVVAYGTAIQVAAGVLLVGLLLWGVTARPLPGPWPVVALVVAAVGLVGAVARRAADDEDETQARTFGTTLCYMAPVVLTNLPPSSDEPFRTLFLVPTLVVAALGVAAVGLSVRSSTDGPTAPGR